MYDNNNIMYILDLCQDLDIDELEMIKNNIGVIIENKEEEGEDL